MKTLLLFLLSFLLGYTCIAQTPNHIKAKNDTLYFENEKYYVPEYPDIKVVYCDSLGNPVDINKCCDGIYIKEYQSKDFTLIQFYHKEDCYGKKD